MKTNAIKTRLSIAAILFFIGSVVLFMPACQKDFDMHEGGQDAEKQTTAALSEGIADGYLIGFHGIPDHALIRSAGGNILRSYNNFPVLHINVPEQAVVGLSRAAGVSFIEPNMAWSVFSNHSVSCPTNNLVCAEGKIKTFHMSRLGVQAAWRSNATGQGIRIAILDTGIDGNHKDLKDNLASDGFSVISTGPPRNRHWLVDPNGHGTHVAGTAGASGELKGSFNALLGVAPKTSLVSVRVLRENASGSWADIAAGVDWCIDNNINVINMSLGGTSISSALELAVQEAWNAGMLIVSSSGNTGVEETRYPAAYEQVIAVAAATEQVDGKASFSTMGSFVELIAPGSHVFSTHINDYGYHYMNGTSMAAPHVSGVAALVWSANPSLTNQEVRDLLRNSAEDLELSSKQQGHGLVRADQAMGIETGRVQGVVYADNQPVYAASLTITNGVDTYITTSSGETGYTLIVPPGIYTATASFNYGFEPVSKQLTVNANELSVMDFSFGEEEPEPEPEPEPDPDPDPEPEPEPEPEPDPEYNITGTVRDSEGNSPLSGVLVTIEGTGFSGTTSMDGSYHITGVNEGNYDITASLSGYVSETKNIPVFGDVNVDFVLEKETIQPPPENGDNPPAIVSFSFSKSTTGVWRRANITWSVADEDGDLATVRLELLNGTTVLESVNISVSGNSASGTNELRSRTTPTDVRIIVSDAKGHTASETKSY